jgi:hypothetical protein
MKKRYLAIGAAILLAVSGQIISTANAQSLAAYKTAQGQVILTGLKPGKLYGVVANTGKGYGVNNFSSTACGEIIINKAASFQSITINRQKITPGSLPVKAYSKCTKSLPVTPKPR